MKKYFILAAVAATFAACSFDKDMGESSSQVQEERIPLLLGYSVSNLNAPVATTRGNVIDLQDKALMTGTPANTVGLFILKDDKFTMTDNSFEQWNLSSSSLTDASPNTGYVKINTSVNLQYPTKTQGINLFAYAPYISNKNGTDATISNIPDSWSPYSTGNLSSDKITFFTEQDQTNPDKFMASDVLWGCQGKIVNSTNNIVSGQKYTDAKNEIHTNSSSTSQAMSTYAPTYSAYYGVYDATEDNCEAIVVMPMEHKGSKIIVNVLADGIDFDKLKNATVNFFVDHLQGELDVKAGTFSAVTGETYTADRKVTLTTHLGIKGNTYGAWDTAEEGKYDINGDGSEYAYQCAAVIVPQTNTETAKTGTGTNEAKAIEITLKTNTSATATTSTTYLYKDTTAHTFASGKKYIYTITVTATGLQVTTKVTDWDEDTWGNSSTNAGGNADLQ